MAERPRELGDFKGMGQYEVNWRLKGNVSPNIYEPLDGWKVILQLCHWEFSHKNFLTDFIRLKLNFI